MIVNRGIVAGEFGNWDSVWTRFAGISVIPDSKTPAQIGIIMIRNIRKSPAPPKNLALNFAIYHHFGKLHTMNGVPTTKGE